MFFRHWDGRILMKLKSNPASCAMPSPIECAFATLYPWQQVDKLTKIHKYVAGAACFFFYKPHVCWFEEPPSQNALITLVRCTLFPLDFRINMLGGQCSVFRELSTPTIQFQAQQFPTPDADLFPITLMRWLEVIPVIITPPSTNRGWGKSCKLIASVSEFKLRCPLHFWLRASLLCQLWYFSNQKTAIWCQINIHKTISGSQTLHSSLESRDFFESWWPLPHARLPHVIPSPTSTSSLKPPSLGDANAFEHSGTGSSGEWKGWKTWG